MFERASGSYRHKNETPVQLKLAGQEPIDAILFNVNGERLLDVLNDPRSFIPIRKSDGEVLLVAKTQIASIIETPDQNNDEQNVDGVKNKSKAFDPYQTLRISPDASLDEIRSAYRARIKAVHPDTVAALDLDEDLSKAASQATQKIIYAYRKILRDRKTEDKMNDSENTKTSA